MTALNPSAKSENSVFSPWTGLTAEHLTDEICQKAVQHAYLHPQMEIAVIAAGSGFLAARLAGLVKRVHLLEGSPRTLEQARQKLKAHNNLFFHGADGDALPLPFECLDALFYPFTWVDSPNLQGVIQELVSVLRPGGRLVFVQLCSQNSQSHLNQAAPANSGSHTGQFLTLLESADLVNVFVADALQVSLPSRGSQGAARESAAVFIVSGTKRVRARQQVQENYAALALGGSGCCGEPATDCCADQPASGCCSGEPHTSRHSGEPEEDCCSGSTGCCSPGEAAWEIAVTWDAGYSDSEKEGIPSAAADFALGCGNPTAMAGLKPGEVVLDIGSGGGLDALIASKRVGPTGFVYGIDMTHAMLQRARKAAADGGYDNVKFRFGFAEELPVEDASIDVVISNCVINLAEDKAKVFREAWRVLKAGGRLEVNDMVFGGPVLPMIRTGSAGWSACISGALPVDEYLNLVARAGFTEVSVRRSNSGGMAGGVEIYSIQVSAIKPPKP